MISHDDAMSLIDEEQAQIGKCKCSFRIRMVGDGCRYCNPEFWKEKLLEQEEDERLEAMKK